MLMTPCAQTVSKTPLASQNETILSDVEISRRVLRIRSRWSVGERLRRRREAEDRFADLMNALEIEAA
jgi:hypothetical protein